MLKMQLSGIDAMAASIHQRVQVFSGQFEHMGPRLLDATEVVYEHTRQRFEEWGGDEWDPLAESTVNRKAAAGYEEPERPLYATGDLFESATSPYGPYSVRIIEDHWAMVGVDWDNDGVQVPVVLSVGDSTRGLPGRPIWPHDLQLVQDIRDALKGKR